MICFANFIAAAENEPEINYENQIAELDKSIDMLKKWQNQYLKKQKSYEAHNRRVLFRSESTTDGKKSKVLADEAKQNAIELQDQIDTLIVRRDTLKSNH